MTPKTQLPIRRRQVSAYIKDNWEQLSAMAWDGYQKHGRGFLLLDNLPSPIFAYANATMLVSEEQKDQHIIKTLADMVDSYNPETEVIIVFWPEDEELVYWFVRAHKPVPPEAVYYQRLPDEAN